MKEEKGITLVALVITIIVMLILTGVTITLVADSGLLNKANEAATETNEAATQEEYLVNGLVDDPNGIFNTYNV